MSGPDRYLAPSAGQTVDHTHVHLIPTDGGDVRDPRGRHTLAIPSGEAPVLEGIGDTLDVVHITSRVTPNDYASLHSRQFGLYGKPIAIPSAPRKREDDTSAGRHIWIVGLRGAALASGG